MKKLSLLIAVIMIFAVFSSAFTANADEVSGVRFTVDDNFTMTEITDTPQTWEFTIKADKDAPDRPGAIICNYRVGNTDSNGIDLRGGGKITLWWGSAGGKNEERLSFNYDVRTGETLKFAVVSDIKNKTATLYVNGEKIETKEGLVLADLCPTDTYMIGGDYRTGAALGENAQWLKNVEIYDFALYSDIRTEDEIKNDLNGYDYKDSNMLCAYDLTKDVNSRETDLSSNGNNLIPHGSFADGYIETVALTGALEFSDEDYYTVSAPKSFPSTIVFALSDGDEAEGNIFESDKYTVKVKDGIVSAVISGKEYSFTDIKLSSGTCSIALTVEKGKATLYCGDKKQTLSDGGIDAVTLEGDVTIGKSLDDTGIYYLAMYSDVRTEDEVKQDFAGIGNDENLISYYNFMKSVSVRVYDFSGNGSTLTPHGDFDWESSQKSVLDNFTPVVRFMVTSDIHVTSSTTARINKVKEAIAASYEYADSSTYNTLDLAAFVGDIADDGYESSWNAAAKLYDDAIDYDETQLLNIMGNHDYYSGSSTASTSELSGKLTTFDSIFEKATSSTSSTKVLSGSSSANVHYVVNGYHFIGISSDQNGWTYSSKVAEWLENELAIAQADTGDDKPIFVFTHIGNVDTVFGTGTSSVYGVPGVTTYEKVLEKYPNAVVFSGHSHKPINDDCSVYQEDYTALNTGTLNYHIVSSYGGALVNFTDGGSTDSETSQFYIVEADAEGNVLVRIYDLNKDAFLDRYYVFNSYDTEDFVYTPDRLEIADIEFDEGAAVTVKDAGETSVSYSFPVSSKDSFAARDYRVDIVQKDTNEVVSSNYYAWKYYNEDYSTVISGRTSGLKAGTEYIIKVYGVNSGFKENIDDTAVVSSEPLTAEFTTTGQAGADIEHAPVTVKGEGITFTASDYYTLENITTYAQTFEFQIKVEKDAKSRLGGVCLNYSDGSTDSNGVDIRDNGHLLLWWSKSGAQQDKRITFTEYNCAIGEVIDVAIVGDVENDEARLYINGELVQSIAADLYDISFIQPYFIGGDYRTANSQSLKQSTLYNLTLYSDVRTDAEIEADRQGADLDDENLIATYDFTQSLEKRYHDLSGNMQTLEGHGVYAYTGDYVYGITDVSTDDDKVTVSLDGKGSDITAVTVDGNSAEFTATKNGVQISTSEISSGEHAFEITISGQTVSGSFTVEKTDAEVSDTAASSDSASDTSDTADKNSGKWIPIAIGAAAVIAIAVAVVVIIKKKK